MKEKVLTSELFKDRKESYAQSVRVKFSNNRLDDSNAFKNLPKPKQDMIIEKKFATMDEKIQVLKNETQYKIYDFNSLDLEIKYISKIIKSTQ